MAELLWGTRTSIWNMTNDDDDQTFKPPGFIVLSACARGCSSLLYVFECVACVYRCETNCNWTEVFGFFVSFNKIVNIKPQHGILDAEVFVSVLTFDQLQPGQDVDAGHLSLQQHLQPISIKHKAQVVAISPSLRRILNQLQLVQNNDMHHHPFYQLLHNQHRHQIDELVLARS